MIMQSLQEQVAWACRILALEAGYGDLTLGHVSARDPGEDTAYIKRKGLVFEEVQPADAILLDLHDDSAFDSPEMHLEAALHTEVYKVRPDVGAVIHGHPPYGTAFGATEAELQYLSHDAVMFVDGLPFYEDSPGLIQAADQGRAVAARLNSCPALILRNHGVLVVGKDVPWAVLTALTLERALRLQSIARSLGPYRAMSRTWARQLYPDKYHDQLVLDYWAAWIRRVRRAGLDVGMPDYD
ncbi:MAG: class II aldolase/adducin family protein [Chloroflexota bacterium]